MARQKAPRTMWLWKLSEFLDNDTARENLFDVCATEEIEQLWVQVSCNFDPRSTHSARTTNSAAWPCIPTSRSNSCSAAQPLHRGRDRLLASRRPLGPGRIRRRFKQSGG